MGELRTEEEVKLKSIFWVLKKFLFLVFGYIAVITQALL